METLKKTSVVQPSFICSKSTVETPEQSWNLFKLNKDTRTMLLFWPKLNSFEQYYWFDPNYRVYGYTAHICTCFLLSPRIFIFLYVYMLIYVDSYVYMLYVYICMFFCMFFLYVYIFTVVLFSNVQF